MVIAKCHFEHAPEILAIFNEAIANSTALYDYKPRTMKTMEAWFETKSRGNFPVLGIFDDSGELAGFSSYGSFRAFPAYKYSAEHSIYIRKDKRGLGLGKLLLEEIIQTAQCQDYHMLIGGIDSSNAASIRLHQSAGFSHCASIKQAGFKFGRWLDLEFYQLILTTPAHPNEE
ncbi:MAG TPA: GNAT family N-acetyltransferase [Verrucomicrobiae bacterium]|jgi:phosphinothricin acetyltransferase|nr:GNAT family N-acetyltransferase [Verrucomicrobiae bacterium]